MLKPKNRSGTQGKFSKMVSDEREARKILIDDQSFKSLKIKCLEENKSMYDVLNENLLYIIENNIEIETFLFMEKTTKKSFSINKEILSKAKKYAVMNNIKLKDLMIYAIKNERNKG